MAIFQMKLELLKSESCPLSKGEKILAERNVFRSLIIMALKSILKFRFNRALRIIKGFNLSFGHLFLIYKERIIINPLYHYTPGNPYKMPFAMNPFAKKSQY